MKPNLSPFEEALRLRTDEVLHYLWDPIGIADCPQARDEYRAYLPEVFGMLISGKSEEEIAAYLVLVEDDRIGLTVTDSRKANAAHVAAVLVDWCETLRETVEGQA